jgi:putative SOS response-associated peptidase YedK
MEWGFLPFYLRSREEVEKFRKGYKDDKGKFHPGLTTLNAKGEELLLPGKIFRDAALKRRCLVPASYFFEWRHVHRIGKKGLPLKTAKKYPYTISLRDIDLFFIAGIWQPWTDKQTGEVTDTFALITTDANSLMKQIHNSKERMPAILPIQLAEEWITDGLTEIQIKEIATYQIPASDMEAHTIRKDFRESADPLAYFNYKELPELN